MELKGDELILYVIVIKFVVDISYEMKDKFFEVVFVEIKEKMLSENLFLVVKILGLFKKMYVCMMLV